MGDPGEGGADLTTTRDVWVTTPLPEGVMALEHMIGHEALGQPFSYELSLLSTNPNIDLSALLGQPMTVHVNLPTGGTRHFNGIVTSATHLDVEEGYARYAVTLQPWLSLLDYQSDSRIYQDKSIPEIIKSVFQRANCPDVRDSLNDGDYGKLEYVVQYCESDFNFVSRLMEQAGIYYFFLHDESKHTLVLADSQGAHSKAQDYEEVEFFPQRETSRGEKEHLWSWVVAQQLRSGGYASTDFDFKKPRASLLSALNQPQSYAHAHTELFDYPGDFLTKTDGDTHVKIRLQERQWEYELVQASGDVRGVGAGDLFSLVGYPRNDQNKEYLIVNASYRIDAGTYESGGGAEEEFRSGLTLLDSKVPFRPALRTRKPRVEGPETAIVVGPSGEEIYTDNYGRVKVQFHWDRHGASNEKSSCWVRVSQAWAGSKWGSVHIPRIGQEVIIDFLKGDPDRPIITGRVYNADNMPPYDLPANQTQSGLKSRSSKGGAPSNFNEIRFEDKKGSEELHIQAEKDETKLVKNNQTANIGADRSLNVGGNETVGIGKNRTETVGANESVTIGANQTLAVTANRTRNVGGSESVTVAVARALTVGAAYQVSVGGAMNETVGGAKAEQVGAARSVAVGGSSSENVGGDKSISAGGGVTIGAGKAVAISAATDLSGTAKNAQIEASDQLSLKCGDATIVLNKNGEITINGDKVTVTSSGDLVMKGAKMSGN